MGAYERHGRIVYGAEAEIVDSYRQFREQPVDQERLAPAGQGYAANQTTLAKTVRVSGPGTFFGKAQRTLEFSPSNQAGWLFDRTDMPDSLPIDVSVKNVWTTARNIVLCSGSPHNYMRMVEHIIALKYMGLDNVRISMDSGDPPLFDRSSMDLVETIDAAQIVETDLPARYVTVKEPVTVGGPYGSFLTFFPAEPGVRRLSLDCAVDFKTAIGQERIQFDVNPETMRHGAFARTNCSSGMMLYCKTVGKLFADMRHLGYTLDNILVAGRADYVNEARMMENGKSLEPVWHRAVLDLVAAIALIDRGRFVGHIESYKAGHALDVVMVKKLYQNDLLVDA
jgi:UDP-3-O-[3-hydroxymyristoyl] N-acetylglucosamine deacetylase